MRIAADPAGRKPAIARFEHADWHLVPVRLHGEVERYLTDGVAPRSWYLRAVLAGELRTLARIARGHEWSALPALCRFLEHDCPSHCWGSQDHFEAWLELGGARGVVRTTEKRGGIYGL